MSAWNDAGTRPDHPCLCETRFHELDTDLTFQMWNGIYFCEDRYDKRAAKLQTEKSINQHVQWREVQP